MTKKINFALLTLVCVFALIVAGLYSVKSNKEEEKSVTKEVSTLKIVPFEANLLHNKAVLLVREGEHLPKVELQLKNLSEKYHFEVVKVEFTEDVKKFGQEQENIVGQNYPIVAQYNEKLTSSPNGPNENYTQMMEIKLNELMDKMVKNEDVSKDIGYLAKQTGLTDQEVKTYLTARINLSKIALQRPLLKEESPILILFDEKKEYARINALNQEEEELTWLLVTKGLLNLSKTESLKALEDMVTKEKDLIVSFGTSNCAYCRNTSPVVERVAKESNLPYHYVDINTVGNKADFEHFYNKEILLSQVDSTPTVVFIRNGKEVNRFVGEQSYLEIQQFIMDSKASKKQEKEVQPAEVSDKAEKNSDTKSTDKKQEKKTSEKEDTSNK